MTEHIIGVCRLLHPPWLKLCELAGAIDGLKDAPLLIGVNHKPVGPTYLAAHDVAATKIFRGIATDFKFEVSPAFGECLVTEAANLFIGVSKPADRGGVGGVALLA